jgi:hypothetical protein
MADRSFSAIKRRGTRIRSTMADSLAFELRHTASRLHRERRDSLTDDDIGKQFVDEVDIIIDSRHSANAELFCMHL